MAKICFSKEFNKLYGQETAELIAVRHITIDENTPIELIDYDTLANDGSRYELTKGCCVQLVFLGNLGIPFCTIRHDHLMDDGEKTKYDYYLGLIGQWFDLERV